MKTDSNETGIMWWSPLSGIFSCDMVSTKSDVNKEIITIKRLLYTIKHLLYTGQKAK